MHTSYCTHYYIIQYIIQYIIHYIITHTYNIIIIITLYRKLAVRVGYKFVLNGFSEQPFIWFLCVNASSNCTLHYIIPARQFKCTRGCSFLLSGDSVVLVNYNPFSEAL